MAKAKIGSDPEGPEWFPWILWLYNHGWEDPDWGQTPVGQITIATAIHELASRLTDGAVKKQIQSATGNVVASMAGRMGK